MYQLTLSELRDLHSFLLDSACRLKDENGNYPAELIDAAWQRFRACDVIWQELAEGHYEL